MKTVLGLSLSLTGLFANSASAGEGSDVLWRMSYYYSRTPEDCGQGRPLDQCSGLRLRGTDSGKAFEPWDPSPASVKSGGVSMSFARKDIKYQDLGLRKNNGFVLTPNDFIAPGEKKLSTLCFYPLDAWTDTRNDSGCTDNQLTKDRTEQRCQDAGIKTAEQWLADYRSVKSDHQKQCGFEIKERPDDAEAFWQGVRARQLIKNDRDAIQTQTEIRVPVWGENEDKALPVLAFIYTPITKQSTEGLKLAMDDQKRYYQKTGKWVPVIRVDLPKNNNEDAIFKYYDADQAAPIPKVDNNCASYIASATWVQREDPNIKGNPWSLMVTPTACGRKITKQQQDAAYAELYSKFGNDPRWNPDNGSMYQQLVCHLEWSGEDNGKTIYTRDKPTWNLEPVRPRASWDEVFKQGCNAY
jgi:hypothetical protein